MKNTFSLVLTVSVFIIGGFMLLAMPNQALAADPLVDTLSPADGATHIAVDADLVITFDQAVDAETGNITLYDAEDNEIEAFDVTADITGSGTTTITVDPAADLSPATSYYVQVDATAFDNAVSESYAGITDATTWNFSTENPSPSTLPNPPSEPTNVVETVEVLDSPEVTMIEEDEMVQEETGLAEEDVVETGEVLDSPEVTIDIEMSSLVKTANSSDVYQLYTDGTIRPFLNENHFMSYYADYSGVTTIPQSEMDLYVLDAPMPLKEGNLVSFETSTKVYLVNADGSLSWITTKSVFYFNGYEFKDVMTMSDALWPLYTIGENITK